MSRNSANAVNGCLSLIIIPLQFISGILGWIEKQEMDKYKMQNYETLWERRAKLNQNNDSIMQNRESLRQYREKRIDQMTLVNMQKETDIAYKQAQIEYIKARTAFLRAGVGGEGEDAELAGSVFMRCGDCKELQSRHLGDTCLTCGSENLQTFRPEVRN